jgi:hypothetical protein
MTVLSLVLAVSTPALEAQETGANTNSIEADDDSATEGKKKEKKKKKAGDATFLPIPIFITEPAIGAGLGVALTYFHKRKGDTDSEASIPRAMTPGTPGETTRKRKRPPTITGIAYR